jgi:hypothetical protein
MMNHYQGPQHAINDKPLILLIYRFVYVTPSVERRLTEPSQLSPFA